MEMSARVNDTPTLLNIFEKHEFTNFCVFLCQIISFLLAYDARVFRQSFQSNTNTPISRNACLPTYLICHAPGHACICRPPGTTRQPCSFYTTFLSPSLHVARFPPHREFPPIVWCAFDAPAASWQTNKLSPIKSIPPSCTTPQFRPFCRPKSWSRFSITLYHSTAFYPTAAHTETPHASAQFRSRHDLLFCNSSIPRSMHPCDTISHIPRD